MKANPRCAFQKPGTLFDLEGTHTKLQCLSFFFFFFGKDFYLCLNFGGKASGTLEISCSIKPKFLGLVVPCSINWPLGQYNSHCPIDSWFGNTLFPHIHGFRHPPPLTHLVSWYSPPATPSSCQGNIPSPVSSSSLFLIFHCPYRRRHAGYA